MATHGYIAADQMQALKAQIKSLTVDRLKHVLRSEGQTVSGIKSELQVRLISYVEKVQNAGDRSKIDRIRTVVNGNNSPYSGSHHYPSPHTPQSSASPQQFYSPHLKHPGQGSSFNMAPNRSTYGHGRPRFADSPFYKIEKSLSDVIECKVRETTRDTARISLILPPEVSEKLQRDENARVMVFCAAENTSGSLKAEIAFPHQVELKCNDEDVKSNLRGLKNKPGSTRPADITSFLKKKIPRFPNNIEMVYALTTKKFYMVINLVQKRPVDQLVSDLRRGKFISKEQVLREMQTKASDPDIVATASVMSLKCPLSFTRIRTPCRGMACNHNQCFDATSYLQLQEQAPTWTCPVCNRSANWENLVLDQYVQSILDTTSKDTEQVTVEPDGKWSKQGAPQTNGTTRTSNPTPSDDDDDDDLVEISDTRMQPVPINPFKALTPSSVRTPPINSSREDSSSAPRASNKRPREEVIDLTLSDDDDPPPPVKRPSMGSSTSASFRARPPDRYQFDFQPPFPPPSFNYDPRYGNSGGNTPTF